MTDNVTQPKKRSAAIDMVKGLSILTLFYLHFEQGAFNYNFNYFIVRSPAFYMVVGWLWGMSSKDRTIKEHWTKRKQGLVKPYIYLSIFFLAFDIILILCQFRDVFIFWRDLYKTLIFRGIGTLWFLPALLGGEMLFLKIRDLKPFAKISSYFICLILIFVYSLYGELGFIGNETYREIADAPARVIKDICDAFLFISIAFFVGRKYGKKIMGQSNLILFIEGAMLLLISFFLLNARVNSELVWTVCFMSGSACAGFGILLLFTAIETIGVVAKPLSYMGKNSLIVMSFHFCFLFQLALIFDKFVMQHENYDGSITLLYFAVGLIAQIVLIELINRKFKFIIGK